MTKTLTATYARRHLRASLDWVYRTNEPIIVTLRGKPVATIISLLYYEKL